MSIENIPLYIEVLIELCFIICFEIYGNELSSEIVKQIAQMHNPNYIMLMESFESGNHTIINHLHEYDLRFQK